MATEITRFELIDTEGRQVVYYGPVRSELQDEGRTLKVFLNRPLKRIAAQLTEEEEQEALQAMAGALNVHPEKLNKALSALLKEFEVKRRR